MSFLTELEVASLSIKRMSLHVVGGESEFTPEAELDSIEQESFFIERIKDVNSSGIFSFKPDSTTKDIIEEIAKEELSFEIGAQRLSKAFSASHVGSSSDGAFFVFELDAGTDDSKLYGMIKYDYKPVVEKTTKDGQVHLRKIVEAFVEDKKALQKSCIVRCISGVAVLEVSAKDRMGKAPDLTDYFAKFLGVTRSRSDEELNNALNSVLREVLNKSKDVIPEGNVGVALSVARGVLRDRSEIDEDAVYEAICAAAGHPEDERVRIELSNCVRSEIKSKKLSGLKFKPDQKILKSSQRRRIKTVEGVIIEYPTSLEGAKVRREQSADGGLIFTVEADRLEGDNLVDGNSRK